MLLYIAAYAVPAAIAWGIFALVFRLLAAIPLLLPLLALAYALWFGLNELLEFSPIRLSLAWQVPSSWVKHRPAPVQALIWGTSLGPGLITRNPYAGIWLLPFLIVLGRDPVMTLITGLLVGAVHGGARAIGVLRNRSCMRDDIDAYLKIMGQQQRWQYLDGLALLLAAGALGAYAIFLLGGHL
ncbi:MAG TPA: hypothetical protein VFA09_19295 [Ktedonobacteraceae bacterium]|nr:hypothetical protein [Ktedonobacteraceae bacterium]